jgi:hypothetical protein
VRIRGQRDCRELCTLLGVVKLVFITIICHLETPVRKACVLQLSPKAISDVTVTVNNFMRNPEYALNGGTSQAQIELFARVAKEVVPYSLEWYMMVVDAKCLHMIAQWPHYSSSVRLRLKRVQMICLPCSAYRRPGSVASP